MGAICRARDLAQRFTRPYTPRTNGKAERVIQTLLREWAYRALCGLGPPDSRARSLAAL